MKWHLNDRQFCIAISGFRLIDPVITRIFTPSYRTPTLHVLGKKDAIVRMARSQPLVDLGENKRVIVHGEGA